MQDALRFIEHCIDRYAEQAWRTAYVMLSNAADADDLLQQAFVVAWRKADQAPRDNPWPWLAAIIGNEARNFRRKRARRQGVRLEDVGEPAMVNDPQDRLARAELAALVHVSLADLSEDQRLAIVLTHLAGLSQSQAADALGIPLNTLKARVRRGLESLRDALGAKAPSLEGTLKNLPVAPPVGGFIAAKAAWTASLAGEVAVVGTTTAATAGGAKALFATIAATLVLTIGVVVAVALPEDKPLQPIAANAISHEPEAGTPPRRESKPEPIPDIGMKSPPQPSVQPDVAPVPTAPAEPENPPDEAETSEPYPFREPIRPPVGSDESLKGLERAYAEFERLQEFVWDEESTQDKKEVLRALGSKDPWQTLGAIEAIREAATQRQVNEACFEEILRLLSKKHKELHEHEVIVVNLFACLMVLTPDDVDSKKKLIDAVVDWHQWTKKTSVRLRDWAELLLLHVTGEDCALCDATVPFWKWKSATLGRQDPGKPPESQARIAPVAFKERVVGTRIVFVVDLSDSMKLATNTEDVEQLRKHMDLPDLPEGATGIDILRLKLASAILALSPADDERKTKPDRDPKKEDDAQYSFAIVAYSTEARRVTDFWIDATEANCKKWSEQVNELQADGLTNFQGGLGEAFLFSEYGRRYPRPELEQEFLWTGAHTIVFITDGFATWSDDSSEQTGTDRWGRKNQIGNGEYVRPEKLIEYVTHQNRFRKIVINTVGMGIHDKELMKAFAKDSSGGYTDWSYSPRYD